MQTHPRARASKYILPNECNYDDFCMRLIEIIKLRLSCTHIHLHVHTSAEAAAVDDDDDDDVGEGRTFACA